MLFTHFYVAVNSSVQRFAFLTREFVGGAVGEPRPVAFRYRRVLSPSESLGVRVKGPTLCHLHHAGEELDRTVAGKLSDFSEAAYAARAPKLAWECFTVFCHLQCGQAGTHEVSMIGCVRKHLKFSSVSGIPQNAHFQPTCDTRAIQSSTLIWAGAS